MTPSVFITNSRNALHKIWRSDVRPLSEVELSQTINFARITLIVGLVFLHYGGFPNALGSPFNGINIDRHQFATFINSFILFFFFSVVPLLSIISGWLYFSFSDDPKGALTRRIRRRFKSLYLPLAFWNALYLAIFLGIFAIAPNLGLVSVIDIDFKTAIWKDYVNAVFALTKNPIGFQFWFVRDLFVTILISPLLWVCLSKGPWAGLVALVLIWLSGYVVLGFLRMDVPTFFYFGGLLRLYKMPIEISRRATTVLLVAYISLAALRAMAPYFVADATYTQFGVLATATRAMRIVGVLACWGIFQRVALTQLGTTVARYGGLAFFLHSAHFPLLAVVKQALWYLVPTDTDLWMLIHYVVSVTITVAIGLVSGLFIARYLPGLFALSNGGRDIREARQRCAILTGDSKPTHGI